jgi:hypothetical protein
MTIRNVLGCLSAVLFLVAAAGAASAEPPLAGKYRAEGKMADGAKYGGQVGIEPSGKAVRLAWVLDSGNKYRGLGLRIDNVLGGVFWSENDRFNDLGVVVYRIDGGKLHGTWMAYGGPEGLVGREELEGPASLEGRFEIALGENPGGGSSYRGHVNIERRGETFVFHWYAPSDSAIGNGIRIGDIMVVGYARGRAPGTVAYCIDGGNLDGVWASGSSARLAQETLRRQSDAGPADQPAGSGTECGGTVAMQWPPAVGN